ncbi:MAG: PaaI family thioesterase [Candidatus Dormibacteria bacterium]
MPAWWSTELSGPPPDGIPDLAWLNDRSDYQRNFVHGLRNPHGLHLQYTVEAGRVVTTWVPGEQHMGFPGVVHGGLVVAVLDDVMGRVPALQRRWVVTARLETRFRAAAEVGVALRFEGWVTGDRRRAIHAEGRAVLGDGTLVAEASGTYLPVSPAIRRRMIANWPGMEGFLELQ